MAMVIQVPNASGKRIRGRASQNKTGSWQINFDNGTGVIISNSEFQGLQSQAGLTYEKIMSQGKPIQHSSGSWKAIDSMEYRCAAAADAWNNTAKDASPEELVRRVRKDGEVKVSSEQEANALLNAGKKQGYNFTTKKVMWGYIVSDARDATAQK